MKSALLPAAVAAALALVTLPALAHDDAYLDKQKAPNGGQLRMAGPLHYELVTEKGALASKASAIVVYVTDHAGATIATKGATGGATILAGKTRSTAALVPDGESRMRGTARYALAQDTKIVVSITLPGAGPEQARFTPGVVTSGAHADPQQRR